MKKNILYLIIVLCLNHISLAQDQKKVSSVGMYFAPVAVGRMISSNNSDYDQLVAQRKNDEIKFGGVAAGISIEGFISKKIIYQSGMAVSFLSASSRSINVIHNNQHSEYMYRNMYSFVDIPFVVGRHFSIGKSFHIATGVGVEANYMFDIYRQNNYRYSDETIDVVKNKVFEVSPNRTNLSWVASITMGLNISDQWNLFIQPTVKNTFFSIWKDSIDERILACQIRFGIARRL